METENICRVLIVEDDIDSQKIFRKMLVNYDLAFCDSDETMDAQLIQKNFNLIIMDIGLAGSKSGLELIKELKTNSKYFHIPIICITSRSYSGQETIVIEAGADSYITKPISKAVLTEAIKKICNC